MVSAPESTAGTWHASPSRGSRALGGRPFERSRSREGHRFGPAPGTGRGRHPEHQHHGTTDSVLEVFSGGSVPERRGVDLHTKESYYEMRTSGPQGTGSVGLLRLELRTSALSVLRSNQLSYSPDE